jgi:hypothetical protein
MKNKLLLLAVGFALTTQMIIAQVPSYVPSNGLVAYYPFNGNANDESGNGNNGTVNGASLTSDRTDNINSAYSFNLNNNITASTNNFPSGNYSRTISLWVYLQSLTSPGGTAFLNYGMLSPNNSCGVGLDDQNGIAFFSWTSPYDLIAYPAINTSEWYHVTATFNGNTSKLYLNGVLLDSVQQTKNTILSNLSIGNNSIDQQTNGKIDDIGIWNRALTQDEIANLYYAENTCQSLVINTGVLSFNPPVYNNTVTIYPNPANDQITIDCGNLANVSGWTIKIVNTLGQEVFSGAMNTQQYVIQLNTWSGQGIYFVKIYDGSNNLMNTKKIILQ